MLQVIISPAKQMRAAQDAFEVLGIPPFVRETARLHRALLDIERNEGSGGLQTLWNVSDRLLTTCLDTLHEFMPVLNDADLADPVHHVLTPQNLNALMRRRGHDGVMVPVHVAAGDLATVGARQAKRVEPREVGTGVVADGGHDLGFATEQHEAVGDVTGAAAELAAHLGNEKSDVQDVDLLGQDVILETVREDHDVVEGN